MDKISRRDLIKKSTIIPILFANTGFNIAKVLHQLTRIPELEWRMILSDRYRGTMITTASLIDLMDEVIKQRGLSV